MVDKTLSNLRSGLTNPDTFSQQENDEAKKELATDVNEILDEGQTDKSILPEESSLTPVYSTPILLPFSDLNLSVRLHNLKPTYLPVVYCPGFTWTGRTPACCIDSFAEIVLLHTVVSVFITQI